MFHKQTVLARLPLFIEVQVQPAVMGLACPLATMLEHQSFAGKGALNTALAVDDVTVREQSATHLEMRDQSTWCHQ